MIPSPFSPWASGIYRAPAFCAVDFGGGMWYTFFRKDAREGDKCQRSQDSMGSSSRCFSSPRSMSKSHPCPLWRVHGRVQRPDHGDDAGRPAAKGVGTGSRMALHTPGGTATDVGRATNQKTAAIGIGGASMIRRIQTCLLYTSRCV